MELPLEHFRKLNPRCENSIEFVKALNEFFPEHKINTRVRISAFLAQTSHECAGYTRFTENLNYSADALERVFPKYFSRAGVSSAGYHRQPERIANRVYANRMRNGDEGSGDGWKYRGRGIIQITGRANYESFTRDTGFDIVGDPDRVIKDVRMMVCVCCWYWSKYNLNKYSDQADIRHQTRVINGGYNGLQHRLDLYGESLKLWKPDGELPEAISKYKEE